MIHTENGMKLVPGLHAIAKEKVAGENNEPGSQEHVILGRCHFLLAQSLYMLDKLLQEVS
jgi:phosphorylase kinase alpha/beta subunit